MCRKKAAFRPMKHEEMELLKKRCGGSWKLVLKYVLVGEKNYRREKPQVIAGSGHSIAVTAKGDVYSFGANSLGQLGLGNTEDQLKPCLISSLQGIRITQAAVSARRTMLVSDRGSVYTFGHDILGWEDTNGSAAINHNSSPKLVESLKDVFVVQVSVGNYFTAVLSREGQVYTFCWGRDKRLGHNTDPVDIEPRLLSGPYEDAPVAQIATGNCYLLMLVYKPTRMSVYSVGCGQGGKLGHGNKESEGIPKLIEHFEAPDRRPLSISAGPFHVAALCCDGRVFTWGWSTYGCLGHDADEEEECTVLPTAVEGSLSGVKAVHLSAGRYTNFVIADNGDVYSFGWGNSLNLGFQDNATDVLSPKLATSLAGLDEKIVQISATNSYDWHNQDTGLAHTIVLTESGKLYSFGGGVKGQLGLGVKLAEAQETVAIPSRVAVDLI
ncbi:hypothetical protein PR202_ga19911 [Eleusine coracana subsp. coracana]|uniref:RCC1-like domain-containing protein n=1 Tax=Eleusine coracana subsp. coracana TaxID=191504 RepID=A0AAV5CV97_ELECO|nr:hypothetical protein QOZ80_4AG0313230 [Eleusine coracana subsp. coracana]GJN02549.1 hypothetical protein PR202_ga19911 [Eleusine coracana subsp. coracana]